MTEAEKLYREACLRHHRILAHYFAVFAWKHTADCVVLGRYGLEPMFNLKQCRAKRLDWFEEDVGPWFPHISQRHDKGKLEAVLLSRLPIPQRASPGWTTTASMLAAELGRHGLRTGEFPGRGSIPDESDMVSSMSLIATGLMPIDKIPGTRGTAAT